MGKVTSPLVGYLPYMRSERKRGVSWADIALAIQRESGIRCNAKAIQELCKYHDRGTAPPPPQPSAPTEPTAATEDEREIETPRDGRIKTLEALLAEFQVDLTEWVVERWVANKWEVGTVIDGVVVTEPLYQVKAWLKRAKSAVMQRRVWDAFLADVTAKAAPALILKHRPVPDAERHMLEIAPVDAHFGKLAWADETGESYDLKIAKERWRDAISDSLRKSAGFPIDRAVLVVSNDGMHFDNYQQTTTGGTFQDADTRYPKMFTTYWTECRWAADAIKVRAPVTIVVVPGNHDRQSAYCVGEVLAAWYAGSKDKAVTVDNTPRRRKYLRYGATLLGFTHGDEEKHPDLPIIMANERKEDWAETIHHEWHVGHFHKAKETRFTAGDSFGGVRVRILPSLSGHDAWHYSKGFNNERRAAEAYLYHYETGYAGHFSSNVLPAMTAA